MRKTTKSYLNHNHVLQTGTGLFQDRNQERDTEHVQQNNRDTCDLMGGWMITWLHAHKELQVTSAAFFFQITRLGLCRPTLACFVLVLWPTLAFESLLQSNFGACRGHQGWGQFTVSSVPLAEEDTKFANDSAFINFISFFDRKPLTFSLYIFKYLNSFKWMIESKEITKILTWMTWKWTDPHPGKASMRMALAGWSELKMCFVLKKVYCIFKNNNN